MAMEPITLFARIADPAAVARCLREIAPAVEIDGSDDDWESAVVAFGRGQDRRTLTFTHDPKYYAEPNWSAQMSGMRGYLGRFPDTDRKVRALVLTTSFRFSLGTLFEPDFDPQDDPRLGILFAVTELLDGVLFTPSSLRDAQGRILFSSGGADEEDPDAVWPQVAGEVSLQEMEAAARQEVEEEGEQDEELCPPSADRVGRRALALAAVTARAVLEQDVENPETAGICEDLLAWVRAVGIEDELEPEEREVVQLQPGQLDPQAQLNSTWRLEGLVVLAWSLGRFELPPHDQLVTHNLLWRSLGLLDAAVAGEILANPTLRSREEIVTLRERLFALHWRLRNFYIRPEVMDFAEFARTAWFGPLDIANLRLVEGDLALRGERIDRVSQDVFASAHSAAQERHQAANWLCDGPERYSEASVAT